MSTVAPDRYRKQFILTCSKDFDLPWESKSIDSYRLYFHPELETYHTRNGDLELYLLGFLYDYRKPELGNSEILELLSRSSSFEEFIESLSHFSGHFVIIYHSGDDLRILNDAGAQKEIYYDSNFTSLGSTPKLLGRSVRVVPHTSPDAISFYSSSEFLRRKEYIADTTHLKNIHHLFANHSIDLNKKQVERYFPNKAIEPVSVSRASELAREMLTGFIKAASLRKKLSMGVTGGYDSRTLFLASVGVDCRYYVSKLDHMSDDHYDITVPLRLTESFNKEFKVITDRRDLDTDEKRLMDESIDYPRYPKKLGEFFNDHIIVNGSLSEIARNVFEYHRKVNGKDLAYLYGYMNDRFVEKEYQEWLDNSKHYFRDYGYNVLDMFYWEERIGNWAAKAKTEMSSLGREVYSPYSSHLLLETLLSTPRRQRDRQRNKLYNLIIKEFSPENSNIPVNPHSKNKLQKLMKTMGIYDLSQKTRLKLRLRPPWYH
ncbi:MAG: hypothetical protein U5K32_09920 [Bacteroidales bacterium]|nr:hypothetical protein [Bacteroidales bacterium]